MHTPQKKTESIIIFILVTVDVKNQNPNSRHLLDKTMFINAEELYQDIEPNHPLGVEYAKLILSKLRNCDAQEIRSNDLGVKYLKTLTVTQFYNLFQTMPKSAWDTMCYFVTFFLYPSYLFFCLRFSCQ